MEPRIKQRAAFTVVGLKHSGKNADNEIPQMWEALGPRFPEIRHAANSHIAYGIVDNFDESSGAFDYLAGIEVDQAVDLPEGMASWEVPGGTYAVFTCTLPTVGEAHTHAYATWLPQSGHERAPGPEFELYDEDFDPRDASSKMEIYIPIR